MRKRYGDEEIVGFLREAESGISVKEFRRRHGESRGISGADSNLIRRVVTVRRVPVRMARRTDS